MLSRVIDLTHRRRSIIRIPLWKLRQRSNDREAPGTSAKAFAVVPSRYSLMRQVPAHQGLQPFVSKVVSYFAQAKDSFSSLLRTSRANPWCQVVLIYVISKLRWRAGLRTYCTRPHDEGVLGCSGVDHEFVLWLAKINCDVGFTSSDLFLWKLSFWRLTFIIRGNCFSRNMCHFLFILGGKALPE